MALNHWAISQLKVFLTKAVLLRTAWEVKPEEIINTYPSFWTPKVSDHFPKVYLWVSVGVDGRESE